MRATIQTLADFVKIQSVSSDPKRASEMSKAVDFLKKYLVDLGAEVQVVGLTNPLICGVIQVDDATKTIGIYGHYDVQPEDPLAEWDSDPFTLTQKKGKLVGRGIADNKGHIIQNFAAIQSLKNEGRLSVNTVFLLEGEEEVGSAHLNDYLSQVTIVDLSSVDVWYVTDTGMYDASTPQIYTGLRGLLYTELSITTGTRDLHSGVYGNRVFNAANLICEIVGDIKDSVTGRVLIPGFYDDIEYPDETEYKQLCRVVQDDEVARRESGQFVLPDCHHDTIHGPLPLSLTSKLLPSADVHGIQVGYGGPGAKTVIPREATTKISFRLVPGQDPANIEQSLRSFLDQIIPKGIKWDLLTLSAEPAFVTDLNDKWSMHTIQTLDEVFENKTVCNRSGGSIPVTGIFQKRYRKPVILTGFTLPDDCIHAPNENFDKMTFWKGIEALKKIYTVPKSQVESVR